MSLSQQEDLKETENDEFDCSSGCDMSFELSSDNVPFASPQQPRQLEFDKCDNNNGTPGPKNVSFSPPYKRVRALRLFDSPLTPKTIIQKSSAATPVPRMRLFGDKPRAVPSAYPRNEKPTANVNPFTPDGKFVYCIICNIFHIRMLPCNTGRLITKKRTRSIRSSPGITKNSIPKLNFNESDAEVEMEIEQPTKRVALQVRSDLAQR